MYNPANDQVTAVWIGVRQVSGKFWLGPPTEGDTTLQDYIIPQRDSPKLSSQLRAACATCCFLHIPPGRLLEKESGGALADPHTRTETSPIGIRGSNTAHCRLHGIWACSVSRGWTPRGILLTAERAAHLHKTEAGPQRPQGGLAERCRMGPEGSCWRGGRRPA